MTLSPEEEQARDIGLIARMTKRDAEAFAAFYDLHASAVYSLLCRLLGNSTEAEDALQETFWQIWRETERYDPSRGSPMAWLIQIARSRGIERRKRLHLALRRDAGAFDEIQDQLHTKETTDRLENEQDIKAVKKALDGIPNEQRDLLILAFFDGLTHQEIADRLETPLGTVKTRIRLGVQKLQDLFCDKA
ncbi:MAG: sigma-70 family RNA polymerase sigma factor [Nitrospirae bacterium]|nr:sigma-70 family RNA polymerase sigma factor [Candidatus Troglogloeales bacterium]